MTLVGPNHSNSWSTPTMERLRRGLTMGVVFGLLAGFGLCSAPARQGDGAAVLKTHTVGSDQAEALSKLLQQIYQDAPNVRVTAVDKASLMVYAAPADQQTIAAGLGSPADRRRLFALIGPQPSKTPDEKKVEVSKKEVVLPTYAMAFNNEAWPKVLDWLSTTTQLPLVLPNPPKGTLTFLPPKIDGEFKKYTIAQILDILNEQLATQKLILIRREGLIGVYGLADKLEPSLGQFVALDELAGKHLGQSEMIRVVYQLTKGDVDDVAIFIKKQLNPLGHVLPVREGSQLVLFDNVAQLRVAVAMLKDMEKPDAAPIKGKVEAPLVLETHTVAAGNADAVAKTLQAHYMDSPTVRITAVGNASVMVYGSAADQRAVAALIKAIGRQRRQ
jgi:hypothetical protein